MTTDNSRADALKSLELIGIEERFVAEYGHRLAQLLHINAFDIADRDAQIMGVLKGEHPAAAPIDDAMLRNAHTLEQIAKMVDRVFSGDVVRDLWGIAQQLRTLAAREAQPAPSPADERAAMADAREIVFDWQAEHGITLAVGAINDLARRITQSNKGQK